MIKIAICDDNNIFLKKAITVAVMRKRELSNKPIPIELKRIIFS